MTTSTAIDTAVERDANFGKKTARKKKHMSAKTRKIIGRIILYTAMTVMAIIMIMPFYYSLVTSFRYELDILYNPVKLIPEQITGKNYLAFFKALERFKTPIGMVIFNTFLITFAIIFFSLLFCSLAAYSLARLNYGGKKAIMKVFYASMMIPGVVSLVPMYGIVQGLGLTNSKLGVIVPGMFSIYGVLFLRSFFMSTPKEIAEAARIDGAGEFRIFSSLYLRMVLPGIITLGLFTFNGNWNAYLWPKIILKRKADYVLAIVIKEFQMVIRATEMGTIMAASIITIIPTVLIFLIGQKFFMDNLSFTGIK